MRVERYVPKIYRKNIFDINYEALKRKGIKCIIFDLDNTILVFDEKEIPPRTKKLLQKLKEEFKIIVMSNNFRSRILKTCKRLEVELVSFSLKPFKKGFKKIQDKYNYSKNEMCIIGDQLITDILGGNNFGILSILVDPISQKDLKVTRINRLLEQKLFKILKEKKILERGKYYES